MKKTNEQSNALTGKEKQQRKNDRIRKACQRIGVGNTITPFVNAVTVASDADAKELKALIARIEKNNGGRIVALHVD